MPAQAPVSATLTSAQTLLPEKPCYMISLDETGAQVTDPAPNYAKHVAAIPANSMLDEFFNQKCPSVVPTPEISWSTVIDEIDGLRLRQFREARDLFYASRTVVSKTDAIFPFHEPDDTFNSCIEALTAVSGIDSPELTLRSDPAMVYSWCVKACLQFGNDLRAERTDGESGEGSAGGGGGGSGGDSVVKRPRLSKEASAEALQLLSKLNHLLG